MTRDEMYKIWMDAKAGIVSLDSLTVSGHTNDSIGDIVWYACLRDGTHNAGMPYIRDGLSKRLCGVLTCSICGLQWAVKMPDIQGVIRDEESRYIELLGRAPSIVKKTIEKRGWSEDTAAFLADTHGIDIELSAAIVSGKFGKQ